MRDASPRAISVVAALRLSNCGVPVSTYNQWTCENQIRRDVPVFSHTDRKVSLRIFGDKECEEGEDV